MKRSVTIRQALQHVADNPIPNNAVMLDLPAHELVCRTLFEIANGASLDDNPSMSRANVARRMIFDRLVGKRRPGSHPATRSRMAVEFVDLTAGEIGGK